MKTGYGTKGTYLKEGRESVTLGNKLETTKPWELRACKRLRGPHFSELNLQSRAIITSSGSSVPIRNTAIEALLRFRRHTEFKKDRNIVATRRVMASHLKEEDDWREKWLKKENMGYAKTKEVKKKYEFSQFFFK
jgi:hypothetical protein